jgi:hypothetical protein
LLLFVRFAHDWLLVLLVVQHDHARVLTGPRLVVACAFDAPRWVTGGSITNNDRALDAGAGLESRRQSQWKVR